MNEAKGDRKRDPVLGKKSAVFWLTPLFVAVWFATGLFVVKPEQRGVITRFGRVIDDSVSPGIHYHWPWPVESVALVRTTEVRSMAVPFGTEKDVQGKDVVGASL
jgi:membrane protease subunit HflK